MLLILRTVIIILLILAFARPTLRGSLSGVPGSDAKTSAAIIIDNSMSMSALTEQGALLESAKVKASQILATFRPGDQIFCITSTDTSSETGTRPFHDFSVLNQHIDGMDTDHRVSNLGAALAFANRQVQKSENINKEVYILSDFQLLPDADSIIVRDRNVFAIPHHPQDLTNLAVKKVVQTNNILERGKVIEMQAIIENTGKQTMRNRLAQLFLNGARVAQTVLDVETGQSVTATFKFVLDQVGFISGLVQLEDDELAFDNQYYFQLHVPEQMRIVLAGNQPEDTRYLELVLQPDAASSQSHRIETISVQQLPFLDLSGYDVVVLANIPGFESSFVERLKNHVTNGGGLFLALGPDVDLRSYNTHLMPALKLPLALQVLGSPHAITASFTLGNMDLDHPVFSGIFETDRAEFAKPLFHFAIQVQNTQRVDPILSYSSGDPCLFEARVGDGKCLVLTTGFAPSLSDLTRRTVFAPLISRSISYLATKNQQVNAASYIGEELRYKLAASQLMQLQMNRPDEKIDQLSPRISGDGAWIFYPDTFVPGFYQLKSGQTILAQWAVNIDPRESTLKYATTTWLENNHFIVVAPDQNLSDFILSRRMGKELWKQLLSIALLLLLIEMLLYREKGEVATDKLATQKI